MAVCSRCAFSCCHSRGMSSSLANHNQRLADGDGVTRLDRNRVDEPRRSSARSRVSGAYSTTAGDVTRAGDASQPPSAITPRTHGHRWRTLVGGGAARRVGRPASVPGCCNSCRTAEPEPDEHAPLPRCPNGPNSRSSPRPRPATSCLATEWPTVHEQQPTVPDEATRRVAATQPRRTNAGVSA